MAKGNIFITKRVMAIAIAIVIALIGFISMQTLPVEQYPDIAPPSVQVKASYTGADPKTIMTSVIQPLEEQINGVQDMTYMTSTATSTGEATIMVYFKQGTDPDMATVNVQNRVQQATALLPADVTKVGVTVTKMQNSFLQITALKSKDGKYEADFIANYIDINVKPRLMRITGVGDVMNLGNTYALRVWLKPDVMAQYNLDPNDIATAINSQSFVTSTGTLGEQSENAYQYPMEYKGTLKSIEEFENIVLTTTHSGNVLYLRDVADIEIGAVSYAMSSTVDGQPGVVFFITQAPGANATEVNEKINALYEELKPSLPAGMEFETLLTSNDFLYAAFHNVIETLIIAILLVILVVYFFLQSFKATIIPSISIIVSLMGTFAVVYLAGFSLNILTLFALVLAIGTVVDDAIVVVEAVMGKIESGVKDGVQATRQAMSEVSTAVISCTLVFMAVFIPVTFMSGTSGSFFTQFGITIASAVGLSCVCALVLCPALCAMMMHAGDDQPQRKGINYYTKKAYAASYNAILGKYKKAVTGYIKHPWISGVLLAITAVLLVLFMNALPSGLVPQEDQGVFLCEVRAPEGSTLHETSEIMKQVEQKVKQIPELDCYSISNGYGMVSNAGSSYATLIVRLKNWEERPGTEHYIENVMMRFYIECMSIKNAQVIPFQTPQIPGYGSTNSVDLVVQDKSDGDMTEFNQQVNMFLAKLNERPEVASAASAYSERFPKYKVEVDPVQCSRSGVSAASVLSTLGAYCGGSYIGNFNQFGKVYRIMVCAAPEYRLDPSSLNNIFIKVKDNKIAPISEFVTLKEVVGSASLKRFNLYQSISCFVNAAAGYSEGQVHEAIKEVFAEVMPSHLTYEYGSMSREVEETSGSNMTILIYLICVILIYLILGSLYNSWFIPFAVLLSVPFGLMGSFLFALIACYMGVPGQENNIYLQTGVIMLIGLLAKTAILITEFASERRKQGLSIPEAALEACRERLRPILMTVVTMIVGMLPLAIAGGAGANGNRALAIGVIGGMSIGTIALLFVVPAFFIIFQKLEERFHGAPVAEESEPDQLSESKPTASDRAQTARLRKNRTHRTLVIVSLCALSAVLLSSCGIYGKYKPNHETPEHLFGDTIQEEYSPIAHMSWREFFRDPQLQNLIDSALVRNTDLNSARIAIEQAQISLKAAKLGYLPSFSLVPSGGASYAHNTGTWTPSYSANMQMDWDLDLFGKNLNQVRKSKALVLQAQYNRQATQANLISSVAQHYLMLQLLDRELDILMRTDSLWNASLETQRALYENGQAYSTAVNQMENSYLNVKTQIVDVKRSIRSTENAICKLLAMTPQSIQRSEWGVYELPERVSAGISAELLEHRPDIQMADQALAEAFYNTNAARSEFFPKISLQGILGWGNNSGVIANPGTLLFNALASLTQPIFAQGRLIAQLKIRKLTFKDLQQQYVQTVIEAGNEVNEALADCQVAKEKDVYYKRQVEVLQDAYVGTHELMNAGKANYLEVLTAQESLLSAQINEVANLYEGMQAIIELYIALGGATE